MERAILDHCEYVYIANTHAVKLVKEGTFVSFLNFVEVSKFNCNASLKTRSLVA